MAFRFQRRIRILPGIRLNISKSGVSTSVGARGAWLTFGRRGTRATVGLPGTGISYTTSAPRPHPASRATEDTDSDARRTSGWFWLVVLVVVATLIWRLAAH